MKKLIAMLMALVLALGCSAALAEEEVVQKVNWDNVKDGVAEIPGDFFKMDDLGLQLWLPEVIVPRVVETEAAEAGVLYSFAADDGSGVAVTFLGLNENDTIDTYLAYLQENGATNMESGMVNDLACVSLDVEASDASMMIYSYDDSHVLQFTYAPMSDEGFFATAQFIMASVMPIPAE